MDQGGDQPLSPRSQGIKWDPADEEAGQQQRVGRPALRRGVSNGSLSIHSVRSRASSAGPAAAIPIQYRTLSIDIEEHQAKAVAEKKKNAVTTDLADLEWHTLAVDELLRRLSVSLKDGLSNDAVTRRTQQHGKNAPAPPQSHWVRQTLGYLFGGFGSVLLIGGILVFVAWKPLGEPPLTANLALAIVLVATFVIQALFNMWQDWSSSRVMHSIKNMLPDECMVVREASQTSILAQDIVPGDIILIKAGNKLPADVRFCEVSSDAKFDRSILTGESAPLGATVDSTDNNYLETRCIGLQGTHCVSGSCRGVVVATGGRTVFGRIATLTNEPRTGLTPLEREVLNFVWIIVSIMAAMIVLVIVLWAAWLRREYPGWINTPNMIVSCVSVAVAFIPEGLPIAVTASLTIGANLMRKFRILCKSLKTVETLGSVSVICSDKTGTLTQNRMVVTDCTSGHDGVRGGLRVLSSEEALETLITDRAMAMGTVPYSVGMMKTQPGGAGYFGFTSQGGRNNGGSPMVSPMETPGVTASNALEQLRTVAALCNAGDFDAATSHLPLAERRIHGDATDQAILRFAESLGPVSETRRAWTARFDLAFNSKNKFMLRVLSLADQTALRDAVPTDVMAVFEPGDLLLTIKGAPEILLSRCSRYVGSSGATLNLDAAARASVERIKDEWSARGRRVLLLAHKVISRSSLQSSPTTGPSAVFEREMMEHSNSGLTLVGLVAIADPPRPEIPDVVSTLRGAGIRVFMVTGDFALTAAAIARECGIITVHPQAVHDLSNLPRHPADGVSSDGTTATTSDSKTNLANTTPGTPAPAYAIVLSGPDLQTLLPHQWDRLATYSEVVFARTTPEQKLRIVRELQARSQVVGMTGDGVNDAPALRAADIGIAVGGGSDLAAEAADMVLLDGSFGSIVEAVRYGRCTFDNLKKTIAYLLPAGSFSEFWPIMTNVAFGVPQILGSFLMIVICCFTDCLAATALAYEKPEADVLLRPPRRPGVDRLVDWKLIVQSYGLIGLLETTASFAMSYWYLQREGFPFGTIWFSFNQFPDGWDSDAYAHHLKVASSIYFVNLVVMQWFNLLAVRTRRLSIFQHAPVFNKETQNLYLLPAILFSLAMVFFWCYIPPIANAIDTAQIPVEFYFLPMAFGMGILLVDEARKYCVRTWPKGVAARLAW